MRPGGKSNGESPFFETPNLSFEGRVGILACTNTLLLLSPQESRSIDALQFPGGPSSNRTPTQHELHACVEIPTPAGRQRSGSLGPSPLFPSVRAF